MMWNPFSNLFGGIFGHWPLMGQVVPTPNDDKPVKPSKPVDREGLGVLYGGGTGMSIFPGYARAPAGSWATYAFMSHHPTLALVYAVVTNPIIAGTRNVKILGDDGTYQPRKRGPVTGDGVTEDENDRYADLLDTTFRPHWSYLMNGCCESLRYGHWLNEVIWERKTYGGGTVDADPLTEQAPSGTFTVIARFKSFQPGKVQLLRDKYNDFAGVELGSEKRDPRYVFNCVNEPHLDPIYGVSRHENCREEWWEKIQAKLIGHQLDQKASGIIPIVEGPTGDQIDENGNTISGYQAAKNLANALSRGEPVFLPAYLFDSENMLDSARGGVDASKFTAFRINFFDAGNTGPHASSILEKLNYIDKELFMAWCRPAQEAMETNFGTKAQAGSHRSVGMLDSDLVHRQIVEQINAGPVRTMNIANLGKDAADKFCFEAAPIEDTAAELRDQLIAQLSGGPEGGKVTVHLDTRRMLKDAELPLVSEEEAQRLEAEAEVKAEMDKQQALDQMQAAKPGAEKEPGTNGDGKPDPALAFSRLIADLD